MAEMSEMLDGNAPEGDTPKPVKRLCSEIQLFDLCDRDSCRSKEGRFCTDTDLLARFERIADAEDTSPQPLRESRDGEDYEDDDEYGFDDDVEEDGFQDNGFEDDEDDRW